MAAKPDKWREYAVVGQGAMEEADECLRFVLYAPENLDELKALLESKIPCLS